MSFCRNAPLMSEICECGWPAANKYHEKVHARMQRYTFDVDGVEFVAVLPWDKWPEEWQDWMRGLVAHNRAAMAEKGLWKVRRYIIDAYRPAGKTGEDGAVLEAAINYRADLVPGLTGNRQQGATL